MFIAGAAMNITGAAIYVTGVSRNYPCNPDCRGKTRILCLFCGDTPAIYIAAPVM
jgi:hypothetical protein